MSKINKGNFRGGLTILFSVLGVWLLFMAISARTKDMETIEELQLKLSAARLEVTKTPRVKEVTKIVVAPAAFADKEIITKYIKSVNIKSYPKQRDLIADALVNNAKEFGIPVEVLLAMIKVESDFRVGVVSKSGAIGLTQVLPKVWLYDKSNKANLVVNGIIKKERELYDPAKNIEAGAYILRHYIDKGVERNVSNPMDYALSRYFGLLKSGKKSSYYEKFCKAVGEFYVFSIRNKKDSEVALLTLKETIQ